MNFDKNVTVCAPINIALIKYWGKEDEEKIIPKNNSISLTLDKHNLQSVTCVRVSSQLEKNSIMLNNKESNVSKRIIFMFENALSRSELPVNDHPQLKFEIISNNNFPTAAGMASSASGMAALAFSFGKIFSLSMEDVSILARLGSGSATRSVYGGIVEWMKESVYESHAVQLYDENYWPDLRILICVVNESEKKVSSTVGMQTTVKTSQLSKYRFEKSVNENLCELRQALITKNFAQLARVTMRESNQFHAICLDTTPPIVYLNFISYGIIEFVNIINELCNEIKVAYTFDAGPNAFIIYEKNFQTILYQLLSFSFGIELQIEESFSIDKMLLQEFYERLPKFPDSIKFVIPTKVGSGPEIINDFLTK